MWERTFCPLSLYCCSLFLPSFTWFFFFKLIEFLTPKTQLALLDLRKWHSERGGGGRIKVSEVFLLFLFFVFEWGGAMGVKLWRVGLRQHRGVSLHVLWYEGSEVMLPPFARERGDLGAVYPTIIFFAKFQRQYPCNIFVVVLDQL